nr:pro-resilin-like [Penaeus vannamei]
MRFLLSAGGANSRFVPSYGYGATTPSSGPAKYDFNYSVNDPPSGNDFGHQEARDGPNTQGSYYVLLPDGRLQRVTYTVNGKVTSLQPQKRSSCSSLGRSFTRSSYIRR